MILVKARIKQSKEGDIIETDLTKKMKKATHAYKPLMSNGKVGRTIRWADEVWTPSGIVDSIRFEDYVSDVYEKCKRINYEPYLRGGDALLKHIPHGSLPLGQCKIEGITFPCKECKGCIYRVRDVKKVSMCTTCFECKITMADFRSKNGHNFHGNRNYYIVPRELVSKIEILVPDNIGIIAYIEKSNSLRMIRECEFREIDNELRWKLLYAAMKKWCDGAIFVSQPQI